MAGSWGFKRYLTPATLCVNRVAMLGSSCSQWQRWVCKPVIAGTWSHRASLVPAAGCSPLLLNSSSVGTVFSCCPGFLEPAAASSPTATNNYINFFKLDGSISGKRPMFLPLLPLTRRVFWKLVSLLRPCSVCSSLHDHAETADFLEFQTAGFQELLEVWGSLLSRYPFWVVLTVLISFLVFFIDWVSCQDWYSRPSWQDSTLSLSKQAQHLIHSRYLQFLQHTDNQLRFDLPNLSCQDLYLKQSC